VRLGTVWCVQQTSHGW